MPSEELHGLLNPSLGKEAFPRIYLVVRDRIEECLNNGPRVKVQMRQNAGIVELWRILSPDETTSPRLPGSGSR
jgi:hypothetical protein